MTLVSILIPVKNEERHIEACLNSVIQFQKPTKVSFEVLVMDGISTDKTNLILKKYAKKYKEIKVFRNKLGIQSSAINLGLRMSKGEWILRLDAHAKYPSEYLLRCIETSIQTKADNTGGIFITEAGGDGYQAHLVQALSTHIFGVGDSGFRTGAKEGWVDTVPYGFYCRKVFDKIGMLDERLVRAQDYEFNRRLIASGGRIFRNPNIKVYYYNQSSFWSFLRKQFFKEAPYNAYMWYLAPYSFTLRHAITGLFAAGVLGGLALGPLYPKAIGAPFLGVMTLYATLAVLSSFQQAIRYKKIRHILFLPLAFFCYHFIHGLGLLAGLLRLATFTAPVQKIQEPWPGAGFYRVPIRKNCSLKNSAK